MPRSSLRHTLVASLVVGGSWAALHHAGAQDAERQLSTRLRGSTGGPLDAVVARATDIGSVYGIAGTAAALALTGRRRAALDVAGAGGVAWIAAQAAKPAARRPRPYQAGEADRLVAVPAGSSWPSGHSAVAVAMGSALAHHGGRRGWALGAALAAFIGSSRVYVGVHYPTDVTAGMGVGLLSWQAWALARRTAARR